MVVRPLLRLTQRLTGVETVFLTLIDLDARQQDVVFALNTAEPLVTEGTREPWPDSLCRSALLAGKPGIVDVAASPPDSLVEGKPGIHGIFAVPVMLQGRTVGSLCGASRHCRPLGSDVLETVELVAQAIASQAGPVACAREANARHAQDACAGAAPRQDAAREPLTGLLNREAFLARYKQELARAVRHGEELAVLCLDVDRFGAINDTHGRKAGDQVLQVLASTLRMVARTEDVTACLGADKFVLVLAHAENVDLARIATRIRSVFTQACAALGMSVSLSIGAACSRNMPRAELLHAADQKLFQRKRKRSSSGSVAPAR